ncbi:MAG: hypothetical protein COB37_05575 [Kordiimonadales bacterium]|nr:MAG: hypothetical protein COB37_05575 [Kordiimonadales bacterium]
MKRVCASVALLLSALVVSSGSHSQDGLPVLEGPYLGQTQPGLTPEVFAPGIVSTENWEIEGVFAPGMKEFYFTRNGGEYSKATIVGMRFKDDRWQKFAEFSRPGEVFISVDGKTMHLGNKYRERTDAGWSEMKDLGSQFEGIRIMRLTASAAGTYYLDEARGVMRYSRLIDGKHEKPIALSAEINAGEWTAHPFIAPDESYLIWDTEKEEGHGGGDLYISFRQENGSWGAAINMGAAINTDLEEGFGGVTPDGKFFFFHRFLSEGKANIFWVDAQIIETLRPKP